MPHHEHSFKVNFITQVCCPETPSRRIQSTATPLTSYQSTSSISDLNGDLPPEGELMRKVLYENLLIPIDSFIHNFHMFGDKAHHPSRLFPKKGGKRATT